MSNVATFGGREVFERVTFRAVGNLHAEHERQQALPATERPDRPSVWSLLERAGITSNPDRLKRHGGAITDLLCEVIDGGPDAIPKLQRRHLSVPIEDGHIDELAGAYVAAAQAEKGTMMVEGDERPVSTELVAALGSLVDPLKTVLVNTPHAEAA